MTRIVVHAGFHKTGTSSVQTMIDRNRVVLAPVLRAFLKPDFTPLTEAARGFSAAPHKVPPAAVGIAARAFFATLDPADPRPVLMSSEDLSGHMPGRRGIDRYGAAPTVMRQIADAARGHFGETAEVTFHFSTRGAEAWLRSVWWQNLRVTRLTDDLPGFTRAHAGAADLEGIVAEVATAVAPARAVSVRLEDIVPCPRGPLEPLLDLLDLPASVRDALTVVGPVNAQPDVDLGPVLLALNRSGFDDAHLSRAKTHLRRLANSQSDLS
ncbi:hypothetical protein [Thetidibacter halocola]|uniref:Uncharacterized protein n=1 Tax=Thetidibacter halocola TaxID=2827239 RepID=A0A8J8B9R5_9RHOB|nr:hypothetical protein [Thetidibacter halocola]MBS0125820.1 hypothetical protein [Thetidibacter halocola]